MGFYRLQDPERGVLGPISLEMVRELLALGAIGDAVTLARDAGPFLPRAHFPELAAASARGARLTDFEGHLAERSFFNVFYELFLKRATGHLTIQSKGRNKDVFFVEGDPVFAASSIESERFGEFMVARGLLERPDLEVALDSMHTDGNRLGDTLIRLGILDPDQVFDGLREQQVVRLTDLCSWEVGEFAYVDGQHYSGEPFDLRLDAADLLLRAAREMPEVMLVERLSAHLHERVALAPEVSLEDSEFRLNGAERSVLRELDGSRTIGEIIARHFENEPRRRATLSVIYLLSEASLLLFTEAT